MKNRNLMFPLFLLPALALLTGCATQEPSLQTGPDAEVTSEGLVRVENSRVDEALMRPDVDFTRFTSIIIDALDLSNVNVIQPANSVRSAGNRKWELTDKDRTYLQDLFQEKMDKYIFDRGGYTRADQAAPDVLRLTVAVVQIAPSAPKETSSIGRGRTYTRGAGTISIAGVLWDAGTGEVVARFADTRESDDYWGQNSTFNNKAEVRRIFDFWAQLFQYRLDALNGKI